MSFLSGLGGIVGGIGGFLTGGIGGAVTGYQAGTQFLGGGGGSKPNLPVLSGQQGGIAKGGFSMPNIPGVVVRGPGGVPLPGYGGSQAMTTHGHYKKDGQWSNRRRPRMNPMNVRAGRRAVTRIKAAEKLFHRFLAVSHPGHVGRVKPKRLKSGR